MEVVQNHREANVGIGGLTGNGVLVATSEPIGALQTAAKRMRQGIAGLPSCCTCALAMLAKPAILTVPEQPVPVENRSLA
jgi:hypothetical protein